MINLENILDDIIEFNNNKQLQVKQIDYTPKSFAESFQTIELYLGRQVGYSKLIARKSTENDLIIVPKMIYKQNMELSCQYWKPYTQPIITYSQISAYNRGGFSCYDKIWIDKSGSLPKEVLNEIYDEFAGACRQFIILGA